MEAIILAGGLGTRLRPILADIPKPMAPIAGQPFMEIILSMLAKKGFKRIVLAVGYQAEKIIAYFGARYHDVELIYEVESTPLGTGGAIRSGLRHCLSDHIYVLNGDTYLELNIAQIESLWKAIVNPIIVLREVTNTSRFGRVELVGQRITGFHEKGLAGAGLINAGCYVLPRSIDKLFPTTPAFSIERDFFMKQIGNIPLYGFIAEGAFIDIGTPEDYFLAQTEIAKLLNKQ